MNNSLEVKSHTANLISIKDREGELDFSSNKLNVLFERCVEQAESVFFKGDRGYYESEEVNFLLKKYSSIVVNLGNRKLTSLCKIVPSCLIVSRKGFKTVWEHYEYPFLFFIGRGTEDNIAIKYLKQNILLENTLEVLKNTFVLYRSFEQDVLWVRKSADVNFGNVSKELGW